MLPGEADAAVRLDRALAGGDAASAHCDLAAAAATSACASSDGEAPGGPERERAGELELEVACWRADARRPGSCRSCGRTARASRRARPRTRAPAGRRRTPRARARRGPRRRSSGTSVASARRRPGSPPTTTPSGRVASDRLAAPRARRRPARRSRRRRRRRRLSAVSRSGTSGPERERPRRLAGGNLRLQIRRERREHERDGREVRAVVEGPAELLEEDGLLEEAEPGAALLLGRPRRPSSRAPPGRPTRASRWRPGTRAPARAAPPARV